jgi:hypothetical protein
VLRNFGGIELPVDGQLFGSEFVAAIGDAAGYWGGSR